MKYKFVLISVLLLVAVSAVAQRDTSRYDTSWTNSNHLPYLLSVLDADVLEGRSVPVAITPRGQQLCFDKIIKLKTITSRGPAEGCLFINTKTGLIAHSPIKPGSIGICDIKPEQPDFKLYVIGLKGNTYQYFNVKKKTGVEHWVQTGNSETYQYQFSSTGSSIPLQKKTERRSYCDDKVKAQAYKAGGRPEVWFLFGKTFPEAVVMEPKKFLGNYAVGYQYTDKGLFIIMQMEGSNYNAKIGEIRDMNICFDPSGFQVFEDERYTKQQQAIQRGREELVRERSKIKPGDCNAQQERKISFQFEAFNRQEENLENSRQGNLHQQVATQQSHTNALINYDDVIQTSIYETELKICRAEKRLSEQNEQTPASSRQRQQEKVSCLHRQLAKQKDTQQKMLRVTTQYPTQPGKQFSEKAKLFMQAVVGCN